MSNQTKEHQELVDKILLALQPYGRVWRNATGAARSLDGKRVISFGLKGSADILGLLWGGRFIAIEVKTGKAVQNKYQKNFQAMVEKYGGIYIVARSVEDVAVVVQLKIEESDVPCEFR